MNPIYWGTEAWDLLFCIVWKYPQQPNTHTKKLYRTLFQLLGDVLPCGECCRSYSGYYQSFPVNNYLDNDKSLQLWLYKVHNMVNAKLRLQGKKVEKDPTFQEVIAKYDILTTDQNLYKYEHRWWRFLLAIAWAFPDRKCKNYKDSYQRWFNCLWQVYPIIEKRTVLHWFILKHPFNFRCRVDIVKVVWSLYKGMAVKNMEYPDFDRCIRKLRGRTLAERSINYNKINNKQNKQNKTTCTSAPTSTSTFTPTPTSTSTPTSSSTSTSTSTSTLSFNSLDSIDGSVWTNPYTELKEQKRKIFPFNQFDRVLSSEWFS